jgi:hypothetical protein
VAGSGSQGALFEDWTHEIERERRRKKKGRGFGLHVLLKRGNLVDDQSSESLETVVQELSSEVRSTCDHEMEA